MAMRTATAWGEAAATGPLPAAPEVLARRHGENFPVALRVLPRAERGDLLALYGFARLVDEVGDRVEGDRRTLLDGIEAEIDAIYAGRTPRHPLLRALAPTVRARSLPDAPFRRLIEANRRDQEVTRYERWEDLLGYCALSANPVGELVLHVFGAASAEHVALSDAVCSALQLVEHWQDVGEDFAAGRIYLPAEDRQRFGCSEHELARSQAGPALRRLLAHEVERSRALLERGDVLVGRLSGAARLAVAGFAAGGHAALDAIARADFDVLGRPRRPRRRGLARHAARLLLRRRR